MTTIQIMQTMQNRLKEVQRSQNECITESGRIIGSKRYEYQTLTKTAREIREGIEFLTNLKKEN